uniref:Uncharacterized protein n=1 Tax=Sphaerodactylus townsendi TaxID=933632 RepID=A0ACB8F5F9_9SAUR
MRTMSVSSSGQLHLRSPNRCSSSSCHQCHFFKRNCSLSRSFKLPSVSRHHRYKHCSNWCRDHDSHTCWSPSEHLRNSRCHSLLPIQVSPELLHTDDLHSHSDKSDTARNFAIQ